MKKGILLATLAFIAVAAYVALRQPNSKERTGSSGSSEQPEAAAAGYAVAQEENGPEFDVPSWVAQIERAERESRMKLLLELLNPRFPREDVLMVYRKFLNHPDLETRIDAARFMFQLGSDEGYPVFIDAFRDAAAGRNVNLLVLELSAQCILRMGRDFPHKEFLAAFEQNPDPSLLRLLSLLQVDGIGNHLMPLFEKRMANAALLGYIKAAGPRALERVSQSYKSGSPREQLDAAFVLDRLGADPNALHTIIEAALQNAELRDGTTYRDGLLGMLALEYLIVAKTEPARETLRLIASQAGASGNSNLSQAALSALFYVYSDNGFVDEMALSFFEGRLAAKGMDRLLFWRIGASSGSPKIRAAAAVQNPKLFHRYFKSPLPPSAWIYQYLPDLPADVVPDA